MYEIELYHHGVKGMKWGIRRDRRKLSGGRKKSKTTDWSDDAKEAAKIKKKKVSEMSNAELKKLNERMKLERNYNNLNPSSVKKGIAFVTAAAGLMGTALAVYNSTNGLVKAGKSVMDGVGNMVMKDLKFGKLTN